MTRAQYINHLEELFGENFENQDRFEVQNCTVDRIGYKLGIEGYSIKLYSGGLLTHSLDKSSDEELVDAFIDTFIEESILGDVRGEVNGTYVAFYPTSKQLPIEREDILDMIERFIELHEELAIEKKLEKRATKYSFNSDKQNVGVEVAKTIKFGMDNNLSILFSRGASLFDMVDSSITIGKSSNWTEDNSYREHIVPCDLIIENAIEMFEQKASLEEVAVMINQNLFIVLITPQEANRLDNELKLKTTMPEGWEFGDSVFARLDVAGISYKTF